MRRTLRLGPALAAAAALVGGAAVAVAGPATAAPATSWQVASPDGAVVSTVKLTAGTLTMTTARAGQKLVTAAGLGVQTSAGDLSTGLSVVSASTKAVRGTYTMVTGKRAVRTIDQNELTLEVRNAAGATMNVVVRAAADGSAYRYVVAGKGTYTVSGEPVRFTVPSSAAAWLQPYNAWYENAFAASTAGTAPAGDVGFPALFRTGTTYTMLTESNVRGTYAGSHLTHAADAGATYGLGLYGGTPVNAKGSLTTPWRVQFAGSAAQLVGSTLVDDLADPQQLDPATNTWIEPGMSAWSWIAAGANHAAQGNLATQESFVDLAQREGWPYMLVDDGWDPAWMPTLVRYAAARGVKINAWFNSGDLWSDAQMVTQFDRLTAWGVTGVKVDFMNSDSQDTFDWYDRIATMTAKYHLMIDFHGATLPKGFQRTWPQIMSYEAVRGEENGRDAGLNTILPFTRNIVGSMDYTPTIFTNNTQTTKAHELAQTVVFESGWQHPADGPSAYGSQPAAADFLANVPTTWDDTRYVSGAPGSSAVLARRSGSNWFVGGLADAATKLSVPLGMLGKGQWLVDMVTDDGTNLTHTTTTATSSTVLSVPAKQHGGFALEACPATAGRTSCYQPVPPVTGTAVLVDADKSSVDTGDVVTVRGTFVVRTAGPARKVSLDVQLPDTWTLLSGAPVTRSSVAEGKSITGTWVVQVGPGGPRGSVDLPVAATFTTPSGRVITSADAVTLTVAQIPPSGTAYLSDLPFLSATTSYGSVQRDTDLRGNPITLGTDPTVYPKGITANANAEVTVYLGGQCSRFDATVGVTPDGDDPAEGSVAFQAFDQNGRALGPAVGTNDAPITIASAPTAFSVSTAGVQQLVLRIGDAGDGINNDHGAYAGAVLHCKG